MKHVLFNPHTAIEHQLVEDVNCGLGVQGYPFEGDFGLLVGGVV